MFLKIILLFLIAYLCYSILPTIYFKYMRKEKVGPEDLLFTFDDGPHPEYTPSVRSLLDTYGEKAIFFVIAKKVKDYPLIVDDCLRAGHLIGMHCYEHTHPALWGPIKTARDMNRAKEVLEKEGIYPRYYRPPHGWVNLAMLWKVHRFGMELKLWTSIPGDWSEAVSVDEIYRKIREASKKGGILCLHDANHAMNSTSQAPENTIEALNQYFENRGEAYSKESQ